jgi:hypothetical protein
MKFSNEWSRRHFLAVSSATAAQAAATLKGLSQTAPSAASAAAAAQRNIQEAARLMPPPEIISGGIQPLMHSMTARPLRYRPIAGDFVIRNGAELFNRPLYAPCSTEHSADFRVDASDVPEFSLYLPGHGGNLKLGFIAASGAASKWAAVADEVVARYRPGRMIYELRDSLLGTGSLRAELITAAEGSGIILKVEGSNLPSGTRLAWAFGGVSGRKGRRNGDIGCEVEPVSQFFQVTAEECADNRYEIPGVSSARSRVQLSSKAAGIMALSFPQGASLQVEDFAAWSKTPAVVISIPTISLPGAPEWKRDQPVAAVEQPILTGSVELEGTPLYLTITRATGQGSQSDQMSTYNEAMFAPDPATAFAARSAQLASLAATLTLDTPDEFLNAAGPALAVAAETIWDAHAQCVLHGGVAWRTMLAGWRGPYSLDALGNHDRAQQHFRHWLKKQNLTAVTTADPAIGPWDDTPNFHLTRKEKMLHSNGDLSGNHYDMNMVFMDVLMRHLMWTGDLDFAREIWPAFQRHLAWEHRLFRRTYTTPDGKALPLYEAYAAIWASDNLQYNGGGAAHSSAYNIFAFRFAAALARLLGEDPTPYQTEADLINEAMQQFLWLPAQGAFAESKDLMEPQTVYSNPALWTVYHTIDSEVPTPRQAWQMGAERLAALRHVPIHGEGVPPNENLYMLSCSDWLPYMWSLNLLLLAENSHMALALWQAGMPDEAFRIFKGTLLDSMFMGLCPGDFHMTSALDAHRQESQRDFGDPIGITSRALVEGLFGIQPNLIANSIRIRPGFPTSWNRASLHHKDFDFAWQRGQLVPSPDKGNPYWPAGTISETYEFTSRLAKFVPVTLTIPARTTHIPTVLCNGTSVESAFDPNAVGSPLLTIKLPASRSYKISVKWEGHSPNLVPLLDREKIGSLFGDTLVHLDIKSVRVGDILNLPQYLWTTQIDDPQQALTKFRITSAGFHTIFANVDDGDCHWTYPISFNAKPAAPAFAAIPALAAAAHAEPLDLTPILKNQLNEIFTRTYDEPRSPYCSLAFPNNDLGGWANADNRATISDAGLRSANGLLHTPIGVDFRTPSGTAPNCLFLSYWKQDAPSTRLALTGHASGIYLLVAGTTLPQCSRMTHATVSVHYSGGTTATLPLRNPETWWPIEQDYLLDDFLFVNEAPLPPRVDLATGQTRILDPIAFHGRGRTVPGGAATILHLPLNPTKNLASLQIQSDLYGIVVALLAATLVRT